ncbi:kinesin-like protein KIN-7C [Prunus yedoensis var. nudiflora]|uniref:Kinesin-like protein KIN-7C n=1 Tax=Prunus yedoensis var. nudiflora TaxID=2094558 RepID=A0A314XI05_PRUYE|nr:kinesin-like protein KIN-7C [Prunus yedoensis var. nudiflora]
MMVEKNESTPPPIDFEKSFTGRPEGVLKKLPSLNYERMRGYQEMALRLLQEVLLLMSVKHKIPHSQLMTRVLNAVR